MKIGRKALLIILPAFLFSIGCLNRKAIVKDTFLLSAAREGAPNSKTSESILAVVPFSIAPAFEGKEVVAHVDENQYESDFYNEYFVTPSLMIAEQTRNWLSESGLFAQVLLPVSSVQPTHILEGHVRTMVLDVRDSAAPQAKLEISFFLVKIHKRDRTIVSENTYSAMKAMGTRSLQGYVSAQNQCLRDILEKLERDLASAL